MERDQVQATPVSMERKLKKGDLIEKLIGSEIKAELLMFFHDNPDVTDTIESIAKKIHRDAKEVEREVEDLTELGLVHQVKLISFNKTRDQDLQKEISRRLVSPEMDEIGSSPTGELTGVGIIDQLLPDGYPSSSAVIVMGDPATGKSTLLLQMVVEGLKHGKNVVYATLDDFPDNIRDAMRNMNLDPAAFEIERGRKALVFIDCYSILVGAKSKEEYSEDPQRLSDLSIVISKALAEASDPSRTILAIDSLTTLIQRTGVRPSFEFLHTLVAKVRSIKASSVASLSRKAFHPAIIAAIQDKVDGVIEMKAEETKDGLERFIRVSKMKGSKHSTMWVPYSTDVELGLVVPSNPTKSTTSA